MIVINYVLEYGGEFVIVRHIQACQIFAGKANEGFSHQMESIRAIRLE
jgi:hypothetical protein